MERVYSMGIYRDRSQDREDGRDRSGDSGESDGALKEPVVNSQYLISRGEDTGVRVVECRGSRRIWRMLRIMRTWNAAQMRKSVIEPSLDQLVAHAFA
jgi:hypothetical protein